MPSAVQIIHRLHGEEDDEVDLGGVLRLGQPQVQLPTAFEDSLDEPIDRVLVAVLKLATVVRTSLRIFRTNRAAEGFLAYCEESENRLCRSLS